LSVGGVGVISVAANIVPKDVAAMIAAFEKGSLAQAQEINYKLLPLVKAFFIETNPIPVKTAMNILGMCSADVRLPLCAMAEANVAKLKNAMKEYGLLK